MRREFSYPTVTPVVRAAGGHNEIALDDRPAPAPRPAAAPRQRDLVRASLLRCPPTDRR
jgi:hypothetical protein